MGSLAPSVRNSAKALILRGRSILLQECVFRGLHVYLLPGGTQEFGEPLGDTVRREVREETGMRVRVDGLLWVREFVERNHLPIEGHGDHVVEFIYRCAPEGGGAPDGGEIPDAAQVGVRWVPLGELAGTTMWPETVRRLLVAWDREGTELVPGYLGDCPYGVAMRAPGAGAFPPPSLRTGVKGAMARPVAGYAGSSRCRARSTRNCSSRSPSGAAYALSPRYSRIWARWSSRVRAHLHPHETHDRLRYAREGW